MVHFKINHSLYTSATKTAMDAPIQSSTIASALGPPIEDKLVSTFTQLDVKLTDESDLEAPYSDSTTEIYDGGDNGEESNLPPPMPFFDRRTNATASAPMLLQGVLSRARSSSPNRGTCGVLRGRDLFKTKAMTMSMPNLHSNRSMYNRGIGHSALDSVAECGGNQGKQVLRSRIEEFDTLLEDL